MNSRFGFPGLKRFICSFGHDHGKCVPLYFMISLIVLVRYKYGSNDAFCDDALVEEHVVKSAHLEELMALRPESAETSPIIRVGFSRQLSRLMYQVGAQTNGMLSGLIRGYPDAEETLHVECVNPTDLFDTLDTASLANVHTEDASEIRNLSAERMLEVISQPVTPSTVSDLFAAESCCLSVAANTIAYCDSHEFIQLMTLWCTIMWTIGLSYDVLEVVLALDQFGMCSRSMERKQLSDIQERVLLLAAYARKKLGANAKRVTSHTFRYDVYVLLFRSSGHLLTLSRSTTTKRTYTRKERRNPLTKEEHHERQCKNGFVPPDELNDDECEAEEEMQRHLSNMKAQEKGTVQVPIRYSS